ncbi:hypothetical protein [Aquicoccus sp. SU-CL01552]|uniref:hypothetical protein n=1 Tax=Aquicoccus sp. SU-CL01552 TaxID=3127656 RepID=UPI00310BBBAF
MKTLSDLQNEAVHLSGLLGGIDVLVHQFAQAGDSIDERRAAGALPAIIEDAIRRADQLASDIECMESRFEKEAAA